MATLVAIAGTSLLLIRSGIAIQDADAAALVASLKALNEDYKQESPVMKREAWPTETFRGGRRPSRSSGR